MGDQEAVEAQRGDGAAKRGEVATAGCGAAFDVEGLEHGSTLRGPAEWGNHVATFAIVHCTKCMSGLRKHAFTRAARRTICRPPNDNTQNSVVEVGEKTMNLSNLLNRLAAAGDRAGAERGPAHIGGVMMVSGVANDHAAAPANDGGRPHILSQRHARRERRANRSV
jgi:hypothetical protein